MAWKVDVERCPRVTASWGITVTVYPRNMSRVSSMGWGWSGVVVTRLATTEKNFPLLLLRGKEVKRIFHVGSDRIVFPVVVAASPGQKYCT